MYTQWWFKEFCKKDKDLEDKKCSAWPPEVDNDPMRALVKLILLKIYQKFLKNSISTILWWFGIWNKLERWKSSIMGASWADQKKKKKIIILKCCLPLLRVTIVNHFTTGQWCMIKLDFIGQPVMTSSAVGLRRSSKAFPKAKLAPKNKNAKVTWWPAGGLLAVWSTTALRIQGKALHLRSILSTSVRYTENCNTCSQHWSTERAQFFFMTMPDGTLHNHCFKSWMNWAAEFCLICHIHLTSCQLTDTFQESQQLFEGKMLPQLAGGRRSFPRVNWILK